MANRRQRKGTQDLNLLDCTTRCQYKPHAKLVTRIAAMGNLELLKHCINVCSNPWNITDIAGRNVLHISSSFGHLDQVDWLLKRKGRTGVDSTDNESRWSSLHRAAYFGHVGILVCLMKHGGNLELLDNDNYTPLHILISNLQNNLQSLPLLSSQYLYVWGSNTNMTLGHDHSRTIPEQLEISPTRGCISKVVLCKFHTVFLSEGGDVYTCGHGHGGRLGHGNDKTCLSPKHVEALKNEVCTDVAAARDHTVFLTDNGVVFTCGLNEACQLGQISKQGSVIQMSLSPCPIKYFKGKIAIGIGTGRYHTAVCTSNKVYTFGKNLGQLGYETMTFVQSQPKGVAGIVVDEGDSISHLSVSDAATACVTRKRKQIFVCVNYTVLRCERLAFPDSVSIVHFSVCASLGELEHKQRKKKESTTGSVGGANRCGVTIGLIDSAHQLWMTHWTEHAKRTCLAPQLMQGSTKFPVIHFSVAKNLSVVTLQGEVFTGPLSNPLPSLLDLKKIPNIQQTSRVFTDFKNANLAVLQNIYRPQEFHLKEKSSFSNDIYNLLSDSNLVDSLTDVTFNVTGKMFSAHKLILSSQSSVFSRIFSSSVVSTGLPKVITSINLQDSFISLSLDSSDVFELFLHYIYGAQITLIPLNQSNQFSKPDDSPPIINSVCSLDDTTYTSDDTSTDWTNLYDEFGIDTNSFSILEIPVLSQESMDLDTDLISLTKRDTEKSNEDQRYILEYVHKTSSLRTDLEQLRILSESFKMEEFTKRIDCVLSSRGKPQSCTIKGSPLYLKQTSSLHDVIIVCDDETELYCHKCVLVSRSDYFHSMLLMSWRETSSEDHVIKIRIPFSQKLLQMVLDYLYTDQVPAVQDSSCFEWLTSALLISDQLLLKRLKSMCELSLSRILTLDNIGYILNLAEIYHAEQLKISCLKFICLNLPAILDSRILEDVSEESLKLLSTTYRKMIPAVAKRTIKFEEPAMEDLPKSYFANEILDLSSEDEYGTENHINGTITPTRIRSPTPDTPLSIGKATPTSGSGRKKRKRKNSSNKGDRKSQLKFTPPVSPEPIEGVLFKSSEATEEKKQSNVEDSEHNREDRESVLVDDCVLQNQETVSNISKNLPWGQTKPLGTQKSTSLVEIMMEEGENENKTKEKVKRSRKSKIKETKEHSSVHENPKDYIRSESLPINLSHSPTSRNPWGMGVSPPISTAVSLRTLMAEAEEEEKRHSLENDSHVKTLSVQRTVTRGVNNSRRSSFPPPSRPPNPLPSRPTIPSSSRGSVVSFADIVSHQQHELDQHLHKQSHKKSFQLIQIEEQAKQELLKLYNANGNPSEYITVEQISRGVVKGTTGPLKRKTSAPYTGTVSAWDKTRQNLVSGCS